MNFSRVRHWVIGVSAFARFRTAATEWRRTRVEAQGLRGEGLGVGVHVAALPNASGDVYLLVTEGPTQRRPGIRWQRLDPLRHAAAETQIRASFSAKCT